MRSEVGHLVRLAALLVGCVVGSSLKVDLYGVVKKNISLVATSCFVFQVMLGRYICVTGPYILQLYCGTGSNISYDHSNWNGCCSSLMNLLTPGTTFFLDTMLIIPFIDIFDDFTAILGG